MHATLFLSFMSVVGVFALPGTWHSQSSQQGSLNREPVLQDSGMGDLSQQGTRGSEELPRDSRSSQHGLSQQDSLSHIPSLQSSGIKGSIPWQQDHSCMVAFVLPNCKHSQQFLKEWKQTPDCSSKLYTVDCSVATNAPLCQKYKIIGYPTVFPFQRGVQQDEYHGSGGCHDVRNALGGGGGFQQQRLSGNTGNANLY